MNKILSLSKDAASNRVVQFIISRYFTYLLQFVNSMLIAAFLGPYALGIWGFINLIIQYFYQINLGIPHAANAIIAVEHDNDQYTSKILANSISLLLMLSAIVVILIGLYYIFDWNLGHKYDLSIYVIRIGAIIILNYFIVLFSNIFRIKGKLFEIAFSQTCQPVFNLVTILFYKNDDLLSALVWANLIAFVIIVGLYIIRSPIKLGINLSNKTIVSIGRRGWFLFLYNSSFYLIFISTRSFVSSYYSVTEFGYFTFAFTLANVVLLLFQSFANLIFPKILNRLAKTSAENSKIIINQIRSSYITCSHLLGYFAIILYPVFVQFFPKYDSTLICFRLTVLAVLISTNTFGYQTYLIAKGREKVLAKFSFIALIINIVSALILVKINSGYEYIILSTIISYLIYTFLICRYSLNYLEVKTTMAELLEYFFPLKISVPFFMVMIFTVAHPHNIWYILPLAIFVVLNKAELFQALKMIIKTIRNPEIINI